MLSSQLLDHVFRVVDLLPPDSVVLVACALEMGDHLTVDELQSSVMGSVALPQERIVLATLLRERGREGKLVPTPHLATALRSSLHTKMAMEKANQVEAVWTGPPSGVTFRRTDQALFEVINSAKQDLLLVTFAAYRVPLLRDAIQYAVDRGVKISFLGESAEESKGKIAFDAAKALTAISEKIRFYIWPLEVRETDSSGHHGSLHAKIALADKDLLLVSSANLTDHALMLNMEMGLLVRGGSLPLQVSDHFRHLRINGRIREAQATFLK